MLFRSNVLSFSMSGYNEGMLTGPALFFSPPTFGAHIDAVSCFITKVSKPQRVGIIATSDAGSQGISTGVKEVLEDAGVSVAFETVPLGATDVTVAVSKIRDSRPQLIFVAGVAQTGALTAKTVRDLGMKTPIFGWLAWGQTPVLKLYSAALNGVIHEGFLAPLDPLPRQATFVKTYQRNYNTLPDAYAAWGYDAVSMVGEAFRRVPNATQKDGVKLARAIEGINYIGAAATWRLQKYSQNDANKHTGMQAKDVIWMVIKNGDYYRIKKQPKACTG